MNELFDRIDSADAANSSSEPAVSWRSRLRFGVGALIMVLATVVLTPMQMIAHYFDPSASTFKRWSARWGRLALWGFGVRVEFSEDTMLDPDQPYIFVANHQNLLDVLVFTAALPYPHGFAVKEALRSVPALGFALRHSPCIFIDRSTPRRAVRSLKRTGRQIRQGHSVLIYPEGERSYCSEMGPFLKGAFHLAIEAGVPVVPVVVRGACHLMDERRYVARSGSVDVVVGAPIATSGLSRPDIPVLSGRARREMEELLEREMPASVANSSTTSPS